MRKGDLHKKLRVERAFCFIMFRDDCVFCNEVGRMKKAAIVYEDDRAMAFMDIAPVEEGHTLVIPREHFVDIFDIDAQDFARVHELSRVLAKAVMKAVGADAMNIGQNNGECANQRVMHYHLHIIPRWCSRRLNWDRNQVNSDELEAVASRIRDAFEDYRGELAL